MLTRGIISTKNPLQSNLTPCHGEDAIANVKTRQLKYLGSAEKVFRWGLGVGGWGLGVGVWGVGFYPFSGGQLPNFQGKSP